MAQQNPNMDNTSGHFSASANIPAGPPALKLLLTEQEAAKALGISRRTLWTLRNNGQIPSIRIGKCVRYSVDSLKQWIDQRDR